MQTSAPSAASGEAGLVTDDSQRELDELRSEVTELKSKLARAQAMAAARDVDDKAETGRRIAAGSNGSRRRIGWRGPVATLLIVLGCVLAPVSVIAVWTSNQVSNTTRYVENVAPLIKQPAVQNALTDKITTAVTDQIRVKSLANQAARQLSSRGLTRLGSLLSTFSGSIAGAVNGLIHSAVAKIVKSPAVARIWIQGNTVAHTQLVRALSGQKGAISVSNGKVVLGLGPFIDQVKHNLAGRGLTIVNKLPTINPTFPLFSAKYLVKAQTGYRLLNTLKWVLPILALVLLGTGVYVARRHRRTLVAAGLGLAASMFVLGAGLTIVRAVYLNKVPNSVLPADAAAVLFDTFVRFIRQGLRVVLVIGLIVALAGFFTGASITAVRTRRAFTSAFEMIRGTGERAGVTTGPVGTWVYRQRTILRVTAVAGAVLAFVFWTDPTGLVVLAIAIVLVAVIGLIELIGRPPRQALSSGSRPAASGPAGAVPAGAGPARERPAASGSAVSGQPPPGQPGRDLPPPRQPGSTAGHAKKST